MTRAPHTSFDVLRQDIASLKDVDEHGMKHTAKLIKKVIYQVTIHDLPAKVLDEFIKDRRSGSFTHYRLTEEAEESIGSRVIII